METCVQYLLLDDSVYERPGFEGAKLVMSPSLRKKKDQEALWNGIDQGLVLVVATDHCPLVNAAAVPGAFTSPKKESLLPPKEKNAMGARTPILRPSIVGAAFASPPRPTR